MNKDTILDNWQEELKHVLGVCKCFDVPEADCPFGGGMTDEERYAKGRVFIASLLQAQRERDTEIVRTLIHKEPLGPTQSYDGLISWAKKNDQIKNVINQILTQNNNE